MKDQKYTLVSAQCHIRVIGYSPFSGLLNLKVEIFKFPLLLSVRGAISGCAGCALYFCVWCTQNSNQNWDAIRELLWMDGQHLPRATFKQDEVQQVPEGLSAWALFGWDLCSSLPPPYPPVKALSQALVPSGWRTAQGKAGQQQRVPQPGFRRWQPTVMSFASITPLQAWIWGLQPQIPTCPLTCLCSSGLKWIA